MRMVGALGVGRSGLGALLPRQGGGLLPALLACWFGCGGEHIVVSSEPSDSDSDSADVSEEPVSVTSTDAVPEAPPVVGECPSEPSSRQLVTGCWPTRHVGRWNGFFIGDPWYEARDGSLEPFPVGDLLLSIDPEGAGELTFGEGPAPPPPHSRSDAYLCANAAPSSRCPAAHKLVEGFPYGLEQVGMLDAGVRVGPIAGEQPLRVGERLSFTISLGQPWRDWCTLQAPVLRECSCLECESDMCFEPELTPQTLDESACEAHAKDSECGWLAARREAPCICAALGCVAREQSLRIELQMSEDGRALRGSYQPVRGDLSAGHVEFSRLP